MISKPTIITNRPHRVRAPQNKTIVPMAQSDEAAAEAQKKEAEKEAERLKKEAEKELAFALPGLFSKGLRRRSRGGCG